MAGVTTVHIVETDPFDQIEDSFCVLEQAVAIVKMAIHELEDIITSVNSRSAIRHGANRAFLGLHGACALLEKEREHISAAQTIFLSFDVHRQFAKAAAAAPDKQGAPV